MPGRNALAASGFFSPMDTFTGSRPTRSGWYTRPGNGARIFSFYGHTHRPLTDYEDGLHILNPGSLRAGGTYGVVDLSDAGVVLNIVRCRP